jgi:hypothetical protein
MCNRHPLPLCQCRVGIEFLAYRTLDIGRPRVLPFDLVRVIRIHGAQLWAKRLFDRIASQSAKAMAFLNELSRKLLKGAENPFLRKQGLKY